MAPKPGERCMAVWLEPNLLDCVTLYARAAGVSRSEFIRQTLSRELCRPLVPEPDREPDHAVAE